tara:strand:- start:762 stop:1547 length:786 start_codon:yes stop_codon:yes gene_type:complete
MSGLGTLVQRAAKTTFNTGTAALKEGRAALSMTRDGAKHVFNGKRKPHIPGVETIVLIHGFGNINGAMDPLARHIESVFQDRFNVFLVGYRTSASYQRMEDQVFEQLDQIYAASDEIVRLVGYSLGANFSIAYSRGELERTHEVIGIAPATNGATVSYIIPEWVPDWMTPEVVLRTRKGSQDIVEFHPSTLPGEVRYSFFRAKEDRIVFDSRGKSGEYPNVFYTVFDKVAHWSLLTDPRCHEAVEILLGDHLDDYHHDEAA